MVHSRRRIRFVLGIILMCGFLLLPAQNVKAASDNLAATAKSSASSSVVQKVSNTKAIPTTSSLPTLPKALPSSVLAQQIQPQQNISAGAMTFMTFLRQSLASVSTMTTAVSNTSLTAGQVDHSTELAATDSDYAGFKNANPPEANNPSYREYQLTDLTTKTLTVKLVSGTDTTGDALNLTKLSTADLGRLTAGSFTVETPDTTDKLTAADVSLSYDSSQHQLSLTLTDQALMKTNGAGTQLKLGIKTTTSPVKTDTAVIGIWRNYVMSPLVSLNISSQYNLQFMLNNGSDSVDDTNPSVSADPIGTAIPNFNLLDKANENSIIDTMFRGDKIATWAGVSNLFYGADSSVPNRANQLNPASHELVQRDPNDPNRILVQFDTDPSSGMNLRLRMFLVLEVSQSNDAVTIKQKLSTIVRIVPARASPRQVYGCIVNMIQT
ncbi:hypothetical protein ACNAN0_10625 [Agrilactobacillus fermenti]|uniref:hypothetical protein n=1 Tax=Agrilactobacillus fermenti TaxID=2586909 RepID=UPI003A5C3FBB